MIVLDTTVLVYAVGDDHDLRWPCRRILELVGEGVVAATTTVEAIQEFVHVRARRRPRADAAELGRSYATVLAPLRRPDADDLRHGFELFEEYTGLGAFDAVLAAVALRSPSRSLVSADAAFAVVNGLRHLDPAGPAFEDALLQG